MGDHESKEFGLYYEAGICYVFFWNKMKRAFDKMTKKEEKTQSEMICWIAEKLDTSDETVRNHFRPRSQIGGPTLPKKITDIKNYGAVLANNEYEFLFKLTDDTFEDKAENQGCAAKTIFNMLYDLLALYEVSDGFNRIPGTDNSDGAWSYFENEIDMIGNTTLFTTCLICPEADFHVPSIAPATLPPSAKADMDITDIAAIIRIAIKIIFVVFFLILIISFAVCRCRCCETSNLPSTPP